MKKLLIICVTAFCFAIIPSQQASAQTGIFEIIKEGVKKVIVAVDLQIQRIQNQTIWLQNAQKVLENEMSKLKLTEISDWAEKQKDLYADYFDELWKVKSAITYYQRITDIIKVQKQLVAEYSTAWNLTQQDDNFTAGELDYIFKVYSGIIDESIKNIDQIFLVLNSFVTQMTDAKRLEIINTAADAIEKNLSDLRQFNQQNIGISFQRAKEKNEVDIVRKLYGLPF